MMPSAVEVERALRKTAMADALVTGEASPRKRDERRLADLRAANAAAERALVAQGARINEFAVLQLQVRTLQRLVVGDDAGRRLAYDLAYQEVVAEGLAEVRADLDRRRLAEGAGRLLVPRPGGAG